MNSSYFIKLNQFEGPLNLLLHLVHVHELDIFDINLQILSEQYLKHLRLMKFNDLKEASSFIQMAASLLELKSRALLPSEENTLLTENLEDSEEDSIQQLQERLLEYRQFQEAAQFLDKRPKLGAQIALSYEHQRLSQKFSQFESALTGDKTGLIILYEQNLSTLADRRETTVKSVRESLTVEEAIKELKKKISKKSYLLLQEWFEQIKTRYELVANILAALQIVRDGAYGIHQEEDKGPLWIYDLAKENLAHSQVTQQKTLLTLSDNPKA